MIRINNSEILEFDADIEVEKQIKLIEEISTVDGDFSYSFEVDPTLLNVKILGYPTPDNINKPVYQRIDADILNNNGDIVYKGYIRIEKILQKIECSFFSGNNNWFNRITGQLSDLNLSQYDNDITESVILASRDNDSGYTFPFVDHGGLLTRSFADLKVEDFLPAIYIKTVFARIFIEAGIKITGELINDWTFNNATLLTGPLQSRLDDRTSYAGKTSPTVIFIDGVDPPQSFKVNWDTVTRYPYFDGSQGNFDIVNERYTADVPMSVEVEVFLDHYVIDLQLWIYKNGAPYKQIGYHAFEGPFVTSTTGKFRMNLEAGDYIETYTVVDLIDPISGDWTIYGGYMRVTPVFLYHFWGDSIVPQWSKQTFVSNILRMFNALTSYSEATKTLTINLFEKLKSKDPIDISEYISDVEVDYSDFISSYGQSSKLSYAEVEYPELRTFDSRKHFKYSKGELTVNNDFIEPDVDIIESDFAHPIAYDNPVFRTPLEKTNFMELSEGEEYEFENVLAGTDDLARFYLVDDTVDEVDILVGDLIRINNENNKAYNGDWIVKAVGIVSDYVDWIELRDLSYNVDIPGSVIKLDYVPTDSEDVFIMINIPNMAIDDFSRSTSYTFNSSSISAIAYAYFDLMDTNEPINDMFIYSLSFGGNNDPRQYQRTMVDRYFSLFSRVLNDPVKLIPTAHFPIQVYNGIDFLKPITIKTLETTNQYYPNRITGYKESYLPCLIELVKLP